MTKQEFLSLDEQNQNDFFANLLNEYLDYPPSDQYEILPNKKVKANYVLVSDVLNEIEESAHNSLIYNLRTQYDVQDNILSCYLDFDGLNKDNFFLFFDDSLSIDLHFKDNLYLDKESFLAFQKQPNIQKLILQFKENVRYFFKMILQYDIVNKVHRLNKLCETLSNVTLPAYNSSYQMRFNFSYYLRSYNDTLISNRILYPLFNYLYYLEDEKIVSITPRPQVFNNQTWERFIFFEFDKARKNIDLSKRSFIDLYESNKSLYLLNCASSLYLYLEEQVSHTVLALNIDLDKYFKSDLEIKNFEDFLNLCLNNTPPDYVIENFVMNWWFYEDIGVHISELNNLNLLKAKEDKSIINPIQYNTSSNHLFYLDKINLLDLLKYLEPDQFNLLLNAKKNISIKINNFIKNMLNTSYFIKHPLLDEKLTSIDDLVFGSALKIMQLQLNDAFLEDTQPELNAKMSQKELYVYKSKQLLDLSNSIYHNLNLLMFYVLIFNKKTLWTSDELDALIEVLNVKFKYLMNAYYSELSLSLNQNKEQKQEDSEINYFYKKIKKLN